MGEVEDAAGDETVGGATDVYTDAASNANELEFRGVTETEITIPNAASTLHGGAAGGRAVFWERAGWDNRTERLGENDCAGEFKKAAGASGASPKVLRTPSRARKRLADLTIPPADPCRS